MTAVHDVAVALGQCVAQKLTETAAGAPDRVCVPVPGEVAWDGCECGQLTVNTVRLYPSRVFPAEAADESGHEVCGLPYLVAQMQVTILRCAPGPDSRGNPPSCGALAAAALTWHTDAQAVRVGAGCCLQGLEEQDTIVGWALREQVAVGPAGGCVGSTLTVLVGFNHCTCPGS